MSDRDYTLGFVARTLLVSFRVSVGLNQDLSGCIYQLYPINENIVYLNVLIETHKGTAHV